MKIYTKTGDKGQTSLIGGQRVSKTDARIEAIGAIDELNAVLGVAAAALSSAASSSAATQSSPGAARSTASQGSADATNPTAADEGPSNLDPIILKIQNHLFDLGAEIASWTDKETKISGISVPVATKAKVEWLENEIDILDKNLTPLQSFILPGGEPTAAYLHLARTVCRRAERRALDLEARNGEVLRYLNRLSDLLFTMARAANAQAGTPDVPWKASS